MDFAENMDWKLSILNSNQVLFWVTYSKHWVYSILLIFGILYFSLPNLEWPEWYWISCTWRKTTMFLNSARRDLSLGEVWNSFDTNFRFDNFQAHGQGNILVFSVNPLGFCREYDWKLSKIEYTQFYSIVVLSILNVSGANQCFA